MLTGNVAKVKVLHELHHLMSKRSAPSILDVGYHGLRPLEFWEPLFASHASHFHLTGIDMHGIEKAQNIVAQRGWKDWVTLCQGSAYNLSNLFKPQSFNAVIATQVLEHVARLSELMQQVTMVLDRGGEGFFTVDSAHWRSRFDLREPVRLVKNLVKKGLSFLGNEQHYDLPWFDYEVAEACKGAGLEIVECRYYNLAPLKFIHNHLVPPNRKNAFIRLWFEVEEFLNEEERMCEKAKHLFLALYLHIRKP
jgi:2-polyprenyl-3-methyl-5-hydroxy-6-metoxy-1,4-benzoquinol methylase